MIGDGMAGVSIEAASHFVEPSRCDTARERWAIEPGFLGLLRCDQPVLPAQHPLHFSFDFDSPLVHPM